MSGFPILSSTAAEHSAAALARRTGRRAGRISIRNKLLINNTFAYMKSFLKLLKLWSIPMLVFLLAACKKEGGGYSTLNITGLGSVAFASGDVVSVYGVGFD